MSKSYVSGNYTIVVSLNERTIYFKVIDTVNFISYEGNADAKELRIQVDLADAFTIVCNCFKQVLGYNANISVNSGFIKVAFNALVGGFLKMSFDLVLREKVMSNDGQLTLNFNRLEQRLNAGLKQLSEKCEQLEQQNADLLEKMSAAHICMANTRHRSNNTISDKFIPIGVREINTMQCSDDANSWEPKMIQYLYDLEKLTVQNYFRYSNFTACEMKSKSLKTLYIQCNGEGNFTSLEGIKEMPELESLTIINAPNLTQVPTVLKSYPNKIQHLKFQGCGQVNVVEMQTYCQTSGIKLEIS